MDRSTYRWKRKENDIPDEQLEQDYRQYLAEEAEASKELHDQIVQSIRTTYISLLGVSLFCIITLIGTKDEALISSMPKVSLPILNYTVSFTGFLIVGPSLLIALFVYLHLFVSEYSRLKIETSNRHAVLPNFDSPPAQFCTDLIYYWMAPLTLVVFAWHTWPIKLMHLPWFWDNVGSLMLSIAILTLLFSAYLQIRRSAKDHRVRLPYLILFFVLIIAVSCVGVRRNLNLYKADLANQELCSRGEPTKPQNEKTEKSTEDTTRYNCKFDFKAANLDRANLTGAGLEGANLESAYLRRAVLRGAKLERAQLQDANLNEATLQGADLHEANLEGADLGGARMEGAFLGKANLKGALLPAARLQGADLTGAILKDVDLRWANLQGARLDGATMQGARFENTRIYRTSPPDVLPNEDTTKKLITSTLDEKAKGKLKPVIDRLATVIALMEKEDRPNTDGIIAGCERIVNLIRAVDKWEDTEEMCKWKQQGSCKNVITVSTAETDIQNNCGSEKLLSSARN